jgi:hypothetical protein
VRHGERAARAALLALAAAGAVGCASFVGVRPRYGPVPGSVLVELEPPPDSVIRALAAATRERGFVVRTVAPREGYLESDWLDLATRDTAQARTGRLDRVVKLRFFADPVAGKTRLLAECVQRIMVDPSLPERELERMVPDGHPGRALLDSVLTGIVGRAER